MTRKNKYGWPEPQTKRAPCASSPTKLGATDTNKRTSAASTDEDDSDGGEGAETPAAPQRGGGPHGQERGGAANRHAPKITTIGPVFSSLPQSQIDGSDTRQRGCVDMDLGAGAPEMVRRDPKA